MGLEESPGGSAIGNGLGRVTREGFLEEMKAVLSPSSGRWIWVRWRRSVWERKQYTQKHQGLKQPNISRKPPVVPLALGRVPAKEGREGRLGS